MSTQSNYVNNLNAISNQITYYCLWVIFPTCIVGNLISLYIYSRPSLNKKTNTGFLYRWLCGVNLVTIVWYSFISRSVTIFGYTVTFPCGMDAFIRRSALVAIPWMQVVVCLDRFICVVFPSKMALMKKRIVHYGIMLGFLAFILLADMTNLLTYPATNSKNVTSCFVASDVTLATNLLANLMRVFIPYGLMLTMNLLVIWRLKSSKVRAGLANATLQVTGNSRTSRQLSNKEFKFTVSTLIIDFVFLCFYLPIGIVFIIGTYNLFSTSITSDPVSNANYNFISNITQMLALSHTSALFVIFIIFNQYFRNELIILFRLNRVFPSANSETSIKVTRVRNTKERD